MSSAFDGARPPDAPEIVDRLGPDRAHRVVVPGRFVRDERKRSVGEHRRVDPVVDAVDPHDRGSVRVDRPDEVVVHGGRPAAGVEAERDEERVQTARRSASRCRRCRARSHDSKNASGGPFGIGLRGSAHEVDALHDVVERHPPAPRAVDLIEPAQIRRGPIGEPELREHRLGHGGREHGWATAVDPTARTGP